MKLEETGKQDVDWIHVAADRDRWRALVNMVIICWANVSFPRGYLFFRFRSVRHSHALLLNCKFCIVIVIRAAIYIQNSEQNCEICRTDAISHEPYRLPDCWRCTAGALGPQTTEFDS